MLARALYTNPSLLILDEPLAALDRDASRRFLELIQELKESSDLSILMISHRHELVDERADTILEIKDRQLLVREPA